MNQSLFSSVDLSSDLLTNLQSLEYHTMTPIQAQSLPLILAGKDVIAQAKTGSGKTAAFALGVLSRLDVKKFRIQALILCPTRELADQVATEIRTLARTIHNIKVLTLCGGVPLGPQVGSLEHGAHIIVGTPGRIVDHLQKRTLSLVDVQTLVFDEADRMLEMGFEPALDAIIAQVPDQRQTLLFSATFPAKIESISQRIMNAPTLIKVESSHDNLTISQHFYKVADNSERTFAVQLLLLQHRPASTLIFCNTKVEVQALADDLKRLGFSALALHGDLEQRDRDQTLVRFANKSVSVLVATDVAARGLDIDALDAVINYHIAREVDIHIHRIGRTGRAGNSGVAFSLFDDKEHYKVALLEDHFDKTISPELLPPANVANQQPDKPAMVTIQIDGGKKQKLRAGDILGALTANPAITADKVGKIQLLANHSYVAVQLKLAKTALNTLAERKLKGRIFRVRLIH